MAGSFSDYLEKKFLDLIAGATAFSAPATLYVALFTDSNTATQRDAGTVTEVSTGTWTNYARVAVTNNTTNFPNASGTLATKSNGTAIDFGTASTSGSVTVTAMGVYDASTSGNLLFWADLTTSKTVSNGDPTRFAISALVLTLD